MTAFPASPEASAPVLHLVRDRDEVGGGRLLPATGVVLIGTPDALPGLIAQVQAAEPGCVITGCVLTGPKGGSNLAAPVLGGLDDLVSLHAKHRFKMALITLPAAMSDLLGKVRSSLRGLGIADRVVPTFADVVSGKAGVSGGVRSESIDPAVLIGRTHYGLDRKAVGKILTGKRVLITGAGGSIGSELARVAAGFGPESLILMERSENALFQIDHEIARRWNGIARRAALHDVVDSEATLRLLMETRPHVVFHAAAHKHVPLMEEHPSHAVNNNLFGTKSIADASLAAGCERFVMISSDKAVNPTSVMGATKRLAERYVAGLARTTSSMRLSMVRFGNVLASACSVVPIWYTQLAEGGPVTVTDPRMTRYFMTIPEAATLVTQAGALEQPAGMAPVYVLDMGEPIRIMDLAERFVRLHGLEPRRMRGGLSAEVALPAEGVVTENTGGASVELRFTGSRPGEKLYEELAYNAEALRPSGHPGINCWAGEHGSDEDPTAVMRMVADASMVRGSAPREAVLEMIRRHVPEMRRG